MYPLDRNSITHLTNDPFVAYAIQVKGMKLSTQKGFVNKMFPQQKQKVVDFDWLF